MFIGGMMMLCLILGTCGSPDIGNTKVVRGVEYIQVNQDSIDSAYYRHKSDSMIKAVKNKSSKTRKYDQQ